MRAIVSVCAALFLVTGAAGCGLLVSSGGDVPRRDGSEASTDGSVAADEGGGRDGGSDAPAEEITRDAATEDGGAAVDAGADGATFSTACATSGCTLECVPPATPPPTEIAGIQLSAAFWPGFNFEVPEGGEVAIRRVGLTLHSTSPSNEPIFVAIVALTAATDAPDDPHLASPDVLGTTTLVVPPGGPPPGGASTIEAEFSIAVTPGWYSVVFGTGAFGASPAAPYPTLIVHSQSGTGVCANGTSPYVLRQSDGSLTYQAATPHVFVVLGPP